MGHGSGLGTSSILAAASLAAIYTAAGVSFDKSRLLHEVLYIEQLLSTGGGWQDQVGGIMGGANRGYSPASVPIRMGVEAIPMSKETMAELNRKILLIHTGKTRLARNLLQNVIRNWYAKEETMISCFYQLIENAKRCAIALGQGDLDQIGQSLSLSSSQKNTLTRGCTPFVVSKFMDEIDPLVYGQSMAGAGGGGFYLAIMKEDVDRSVIQHILASVEGTSKFTIHTATVDKTGITLSVDGKCMNIPNNEQPEATRDQF